MRKIIIILLIVLLFIIGIIIGHNIFNTEDVYMRYEKTDESVIEESNTIENLNKVANSIDNKSIEYNIEGEYEPNYDEIEPGYVGTAFRFFFKDGKVTYYTDGEFEGTYTIEGNVLKVVYTICYNPSTGEPEEPEYLKGCELTIINDDTLQTSEGLNFYKK